MWNTEENVKNNTYELIKCSKLLKDINKEQQFEIIKSFHEDITNNREINETETRISSKYYLPSLHMDINQYIHNCDQCQINKYDRNFNKKSL